MKCLAGVLFLLVAGGAFSSRAESFGTLTEGAGWVYTRLGDARDVQTQTAFGVFLGGGGKDLDPAFQWMCQKANGGDFLILRASGTGAYNPYVQGLCPAIHSVATLRIQNRAAAYDPFVESTIRKAEALFIAGGDQGNYVNFWQGTPVERAISELAARGIPVGGTSAGTAILAQYAFSALHDTVTSEQALSDPFDPRVTIDEGFLRVSALLRNTITDTHFAARNRMGRLIVFLARMELAASAASGAVGTVHLGSSHANRMSAIAVDERTGLLVEPNGKSAVVGAGNVYFLRTAGLPEICRAHVPLRFGGVEVVRVPAAATFNISTWTGTGGNAYRISASAGALQSTQAGGEVY